MCPTEDSQWCYWDAASHGNGHGNSFISLWEGTTINMVNGLTILVLVSAVAVIWWLAAKGKLGK